MNKTVSRVIGLQVAATLAIALGLMLSYDVRVAWSALAGGAIGFVPNILYGLKAYSISKASPEKALRILYAAEFLKIAATLALFAAAFVWLKNIVFWPMFVTYMATLAAYWIALIFDSGKIREF